MNHLKKELHTRHRVVLSLLSAALLSSGWIGGGGLPLFLSLVPLLVISVNYGPSWRDAWRMFGYLVLTFLLWNAATIWWVWKASPLGPIVASIVSSWWNALAFMVFHYVSKRAPKVLSYVLFVVGWIATEQIYIQAPVMSFPWLTLGNGFADDTWAVQWYELTGVLGGSLWVLLVNIFVFEGLRTFRKRMWVVATIMLFLPMGISWILYDVNKPERTATNQEVCISVVQPNVDCYNDKFNGSVARQQENLLQLLAETPDSTQFVLMPETSLGITINEEYTDVPTIRRFAKAMEYKEGNPMLIVGCESLRIYGRTKSTDTARQADNGMWYDIYNTAIGFDSSAVTQIHEKGRLVIGVETIPAWFRSGGLFEVDLGGTAGQLGIGKTAQPFVHDGIQIAPAICYEGLYGDYIGEYVRNGAEIVGVISNDGWWGNTLGHKWLFAFCRLRAIEHRRAIARSANTGVSGFITQRGDDVERMGWDRRGVLTAKLHTNDRVTFYTRHGDWMGRMSQYISLVCLLYFVAYRIRKRQYLVN